MAPKAASLENALAVAWFTGANEAPAVKIAFSKDNGANFEEPITIESDKMMGRVDIVLIDMDTALVSYMESKDKSAQLKVVKINRSGKPIKIKSNCRNEFLQKNRFSANGASRRQSLFCLDGCNQ